MKELLKKFENKQPEIVFEWSDSESEAEGWLVINSLREGAAGGGTRMRKGLDKREVASLAKNMEVKYTVSGPPIGGAQSGINFDPHDPRKEGVLKRWYKVVMPLLKNYYGTGGDLYVDEVNEVIPITEAYGLWHPQEGIVNGHFQAKEPEKIRRIGQLRQGLSKLLEDPAYTLDGLKKYSVSEMITGYGISESIRHFYKIWGGNIKNKRAVIQGWGDVGASAACYLTVLGAKIVGIMDKEAGLINPEGFSLEEIKSMFIHRDGNKLVADNLIPIDKLNQRIWNLEREIFIPAATSRLINKDHVNSMIGSGLEIIACGANAPFTDQEIFLGPIGIYTDDRVALIPDFISNCGKARTLAYLMSDKAVLSDDGIFRDVSKTIAKALKKTYSENQKKTKIAQTSLEIALEQLV